MEETLQNWQQIFDSLPRGLRDAICQEGPGGVAWCEEIFVGAFSKAPHVFGDGAQALLARIDALCPAFRFRVRSALAALCRYLPVADLAPAPQLQEVLAHPGCDPRRPLSLLEVLGRTDGALLRRATGDAAPQLWGEAWPRGAGRATLMVASGPFHGLSVGLRRDRAVGLGRADRGWGSRPDHGLTLCDESIAPWGRPGEPPVQVRLCPAEVEIQVREGVAFWGQDLWDWHDPLEGPAVRRHPLPPGAHLLRIGSTLLRLLLPARKGRQGPLRVFLSHSAADEDHAGQLRAHLGDLVEQGRIEVWGRRDLIEGDEVSIELEAQVNRAGLLLLLVSADYQSDPALEFERVRSLERPRLEPGVRVWPILVRPVESSLFALRPVGGSYRAISQWADPHEAWALLRRDIELEALEPDE